MKLNAMKLGMMLLACILAIGTVSANPGFNMVVTPIASTVKQGETAQFSVTITAIDTLDIEELVELEVIDLNGNPVSWTTRFSGNSFIIGPYLTNPQKTVTLEIDIPAGAPVGSYIQKVHGNAYLPDLTELGSVESSEFPITVVVTEIPEYPTIMMPIISVIGLMILFQRRKGK